MSAEFVIIAGPQAAGKSTVITQLAMRYQNIIPFLSRTKIRVPVSLPFQESKQIIGNQNGLLGRISMTAKEEREIIERDLKHMDIILKRKDGRNLVYLDECNIFTIVYAAEHGVTQISNFREEYLQRLEKLQAKVIFLDVPPKVSWFRRRQSYKERLVYFPKDQHKALMIRYQKYLQKLHPELLKLYGDLPLPKRKINVNCPIKIVLQKTNESLAQISSFFK